MPFRPSGVVRVVLWKRRLPRWKRNRNQNPPSLTPNSEIPLSKHCCVLLYLLTAPRSLILIAVIVSELLVETISQSKNSNTCLGELFCRSSSCMYPKFNWTDSFTFKSACDLAIAKIEGFSAKGQGGLSATTRDHRRWVIPSNFHYFIILTDFTQLHLFSMCSLSAARIFSEDFFKAICCWLLLIETETSKWSEERRLGELLVLLLYELFRFLYLICCELCDL